MIRCKLTFRDYSQNYLQKFEEVILQHTFTNIENLSKISTKHFDAATNDLSGERYETDYEYQLKKFPEELHYHGCCASLAEVINVFNDTQKQLKADGLNECASVFFTLQSKSLYPTNFSLQNVFPVFRGVFGNIYKKYCFNPVISVTSSREAKPDILHEFLKEQKAIDNFHYNMAAIFEHDHDAFSTFFYDFYANLHRVIELKIEYASIRRIIAYLCHTDNGKLGAILTFQLSYPPYVHPRRKHENTTDNNNQSTYFTRDRFVTWNKAFAKEADICFSSCFSLECFDVDGHQLLDCFDRLQKITGLDIEFRDLPNSNNVFIKHQYYQKDLLKFPELLPKNLQKLQRHVTRYFPLLYAIDALTSRGGEIYDHFFRKQTDNFEQFLRLVVKSYDDDRATEPGKPVTKTVRTLELMLEKLDLMLDIPEPIEFFTRLYEQLDNNFGPELTQEMVKKGYMRVRKITVTPTRILLFNPDIIMGNRCLRKSGSDTMIRVDFRDENNSKLFGVQRVLACKTIDNFLNDSKIIGMRIFSYLGSSDFQMRDHGCYLYAGTREDVEKFKKRFGIFKLESIPIMSSRFGQCLTQSLLSGVELQRENYSEICDHEAGLDSNNNPYKFTDGLGIMSQEYAQKLSADLGCPDYVISCIQMRYRGYKGVLALDTFGKINGYCPGRKEDDLVNPLLMMLRRSQKTFYGPRPTFQSIEILKVSLPIPVTLNKPLINIFDQVSEKQGSKTHDKIKNRLFELLDNSIKGVISPLMEQDAACMAVNEYQKIIPAQIFRNFNITEEPFFRSMLRTSALVRLNQLNDKMKIKIPSSLGRVMFGIIDESGTLQPGQVFIRFSNSVDSKFPRNSSERTTLNGRVLITTKSATAPGDIRMYEAVDIENFYNFVDVVVFSKNGERPDYHDIGVSDLSGDEHFTVIWDSELFFDSNEKAFDYSQPITELPQNYEDPNFDDNLPALMIESFKNYMCEDLLGVISNSHMANSDLYGIFSDHCSKIAQKQNLANDYQQTGIKPERLTKEWTENGLPPEKVERFPDFMDKTVAPIYKSERVMSLLHARLTEIKNVIKLGEESDLDLIQIDQSLVIPDDDSYYDGAVKLYNTYSSLVQSICDTYGICNDGQLFSNHFSTLKKLLSERDEENMILFNTQNVIEEQLTNIFEKYRIEFFEEFGGIIKNTVVDETLCHPEMRETFSRSCKSPSIEIQKKASAFYRAAYSDKKYLSFAWMVADILMINRQTSLKLDKGYLSSSSLEKKLSTAIYDVISDPENNSEFGKFLKSLNHAYQDRKSNDDVSFITGRLCRFRNGMDKLLFFVRKWSEKHGLAGILPKCLDALFICVTSGRLNDSCEPCFELPQYYTDAITSLEDLEGGLGRIYLKFIQYLSTQEFRASSIPNLMPVSNRKLTNKDCVMLHYEAIQTFYPIAVNRIFDALPDTPKDEKLVEDEIFVVDLPIEAKEDAEKLLKKFAEKCGCKYIAVKRKPEPRFAQKTHRFALKVVGTFWNVWKFRRLLLATPKMNEADFQKRSEMLAVDVYDKLKQYGENEVEIVDDKF